MTEREYILATSLARVRAAIGLVLGVEVGEETRINCRASVLLPLRTWESMLEEDVNEARKPTEREKEGEPSPPVSLADAAGSFSKEFRDDGWLTSAGQGDSRIVAYCRFESGMRHMREQVPTWEGWPVEYRFHGEFATLGGA